MDGKAKIGILQFKSLLPEQSGARSQGFIDEVTKLPGVEIVSDQDAWLQDKGNHGCWRYADCKPGYQPSVGCE